MKYYLFILMSFCFVISSSAQEQEVFEMRVWENKKGRKISATYAGVKDGKVKMTLKNGRSATVPIEQLSDKDIVWVKEMLAKQEAVRQAEVEKTKHIPKADQLSSVPSNVIYAVNDKYQKKYFYIDAKGKRLLDHLSFVAPVQQFSEGLALVKVRAAEGSSETLSGFINLKGEWVLGGKSAKLLPSGLSVVTGFKEGLAVVSEPANNGKATTFGYMDKEGKVVVPMGKFLRLSSLDNGRAVAYYWKDKSRVTGIVDRTGKIIEDNKEWSGVQLDGKLTLISDFKGNSRVIDDLGSIIYRSSVDGALKNGIFFPKDESGVVSLKSGKPVVLPDTKGLMVSMISSSCQLAVIYKQRSNTLRFYNLKTGGMYGPKFYFIGSFANLGKVNRAAPNTFGSSLMTFIEKNASSDNRTVVVNYKGEYIYKGMSSRGETW